MRAFGVEANWHPSGDRLDVAAGQAYKGCEYHVEPDASAAVYPLCAAAIAGGHRPLGISKDSRLRRISLCVPLRKSENYKKLPPVDTSFVFPSGKITKH